MKIHAYIYHHMPYGNEEQFLTAWPCHVGNDEYRTFIAEMDFEVEGLEIPIMEKIVENRVAILREQIEKIKADSFIEIKKIEDKIQQLLCLENKEVAAI